MENQSQCKWMKKIRKPEFLGQKKECNVLQCPFGPAIFKSLTTDLDRIVMTVGGKVKLHLVFGDITNEATEAVVNTTDFQYFNSGR